MTTDTISRKRRNLGYGWTNAVEQGGECLRVKAPQEDVRGGPRTVLQERADACRINNGNDWRGAWFVGGQRVVRVVDPEYMHVSDIGDFLAWPEMYTNDGEITVEVATEEGD